MTTDDRRPGAEGLCGIPGTDHAPGSRLYPCGWRCALHTPNALAGRPETPPGPGWPIYRQPPTDTADEASGMTGTKHEDPTR
ncbi:hypothetical protein [Streptomyces sp. NPDC001508]|uniref:hypothetical protein n=1 Tax=Streptomyces sp. NPDC001508 TaxID=3154656 RepID=UPI003320501F